MGFSRQEYWSGLPFPPPGDLPNPGIKPALTGRFFTTSATWETPISQHLDLILLTRYRFYLAHDLNYLQLMCPQRKMHCLETPRLILTVAQKQCQHFLAWKA